jgi:WD40 repeat protein
MIWSNFSMLLSASFLKRFGPILSILLVSSILNGNFPAPAIAMPALQVKVPAGIAKVNHVRFSAQAGLAWSVDENGSSIWNLQGIYQADYFANTNILDISSDGHQLVLSKRLPSDIDAEYKKRFEEYKKQIAGVPAAQQKEMLEAYQKALAKVQTSSVGSYSQKLELSIYDQISKKTLRRFKDPNPGGESDSFTAARLLTNPAYLVALGMGQIGLKVFNTHTGKLVWKAPANSGLGQAGLDISGDMLITGTQNLAIQLLNLSTGQVIREFHGHTLNPSALRFFQGGKKFVSLSFDRSLRIWDVLSGREIRAIQAPADQTLSIFSDLTFSPDEQFLAVCGLDGYVTVWDLKQFKMVKRFQAHQTQATSLAWSPEGKYIFTGSMDGTIKLWKTDKFELVLTARSNNKGEYALWTPEGYFEASRNGGELISLVKGIDIFAVDQFAMHLNRPDILQERVGYAQEDAIRYFKGRYLHRLQRAGLSSIAPTEADLPTTEIIEAQQQQKQARLKFKLHSAKESLKSYQIYINDVPLFGPEGKSLNGKEAILTQDLELTSGKNKIEVSCTNQAGLESLRSLSNFNYAPQVKGDLYFIGFGVSKYRDKSLNLLYAHKDAQDLSAVFGKMQKRFQKIHTRTLLNEQVTASNVQAAKDFLKNAKPEDTVVLFIAGHGVHDGDPDATYYYLTHETDLKRLSSTAVRFETIEDILQAIQPRHKFFFMDTCESGEIDPTEESFFQAQAQQQKIAPRAIRGLSIRSKPTQAASQSSSTRTYLLERNRYIYNDLLRRSGALVFSSSRGGEYAYEPSQYLPQENGFFTKALLQSLTSSVADSNSDGWISRKEMTQYVSSNVSQRTNGLQNPTIDRDNLSLEVMFPIVK